MARNVMLDANIYTDRTYEEPVGRIRDLYVSSVVVQELMVIAEKRQQKELSADFHEKVRMGSGLVPDATDWLEVGKCLAYLCSNERFGRQEVKLLVKDALIARTAMRVNAILVTSNIADFAKIKNFFRSLAFISPSEYFGTRPR
jgi:predicted nucleic acid-binding protein